MKQQTNEKNQADANQKYADHLHELKAREMDQRACELAKAEADCRRAINMATKDMNEALARERQAKEDAEKRQEQDDNFTEISNHVFGDMLTENPDVAQSAFGPHRVITDRWKGMSPAQLAEIRRIQQAQIEEKEVRNCQLVNVTASLFRVSPIPYRSTNKQRIILCFLNRKTDCCTG